MGGRGTGGAGGAGGVTPTRAEVQAILDSHGCGQCHTGTRSTTRTDGLPGIMNLRDVGTVINAPSIECGEKARIARGSARISYLVDKLLGASQTPAGCFALAQMPINRAALLPPDIATISAWIDANAP
jgi:hypothetical protein